MKEVKISRTDFLFCTPNFWTGAASSINLFGNFYEFNTSETGAEADMRAIQNDFDMVGQDLNNVLKSLKVANNLLR